MTAIGPARNGQTERVAPLLAFVHIPKTAGTTLGTLLRRHYDPAFRRINTSGAHEPAELRRRVAETLDRPGLEAVQGHITAGVLHLLPADAVLVTILREPVERTLSQYHHLITRTGRWQHDWLAPPSPQLTIAECLGARGYIADNLQTRMLCGTLSPIEPLPADAFDRAKSLLRDRFDYVGTTERFDEFLVLLNLDLGWSTLAYESARVAPGRPRREDMSAEDLARIEAANALDLELYEFAASLLARSLEQAGPALEPERDVLRAAQRCLNGVGDARPSAVLLRSFPAEARVDLAVLECRLMRAEAELKRLRKRVNTLAAVARRFRTFKRERKRRSVKGRLDRIRARVG